MSLQLTPGTASELAPSPYMSGRAVAAAELRLQIGMADLDGLLADLSRHTGGFLGPDVEVDIDAYRRRIAHVDAAQHELELSVERLSDLIGVGADTLLITLGRSVCHQLERIVESVRAHLSAVEDSA